MKAVKNWPESASFLVDWLEKNNLIEDVERWAGYNIKKATNADGLGNLFDFSLMNSPEYWFDMSIKYKKAYDTMVFKSMKTRFKD